MLVAAITGPRQAALVERPNPVARGEFAVVRITCAPMCTEVRQYSSGQASDCLGHEAAGEVMEVGRRSRIRPGSRVVVMPTYPCGCCRLCHQGDYIHCEQGLDPHALCGCPTGTATYAQFLVKQDWLLLPIPDDLETEEGAMACCGFGPAFGAMRRTATRAGDSVLVVGLGPVGLGAVVAACDCGARVIAFDSNPYRRRLALELGARTAIDALDPEAAAQVRAASGGDGADVVVECAGRPEAQSFALSAARRRGQVAFIGGGGNVELGNPVPRGLTVHGCWHWNLQDADAMFSLIRRNRGSIARLISHRYPLSRVRDAWEQQISGECGKVMLDPWA
jgi:L-iditol 2-dehydrogenase